MSNASVALIASALMIEQVTYWLDFDADELVTESTPAEHYYNIEKLVSCFNWLRINLLSLRVPADWC